MAWGHAASRNPVVSALLSRSCSARQRGRGQKPAAVGETLSHNTVPGEMERPVAVLRAAADAARPGCTHRTPPSSSAHVLHVCMKRRHAESDRSIPRTPARSRFYSMTWDQRRPDEHHQLWQDVAGRPTSTCSHAHKRTASIRDGCGDLHQHSAPAPRATGAAEHAVQDPATPCRVGSTPQARRAAPPRPPPRPPPPAPPAASPPPRPPACCATPAPPAPASAAPPARAPPPRPRPQPPPPARRPGTDWPAAPAPRACTPPGAAPLGATTRRGNRSLSLPAPRPGAPEGAR